ncbi:MAG: PucC family protein [Desulfobacterales bacterium]|nr:PucC family protein [Desulfobacterales bacterium]
MGAGGRPASDRPDFAGEVLAALAFLMTGLGMHMTQTAGLALAADRATDETRPRVVALLYVMFLLGMAVSAVIVGWLLRDFDPITLIRVVQGCAVATMVLNMIALWKQEKVRPMTRAERAGAAPALPRRLGRLRPRRHRGAASGGRVPGHHGLQHAGRAAGTLWRRDPGPVGVRHHASDRDVDALGALVGLRCWPARWLARGIDPFRMAARGLLVGHRGLFGRHLRRPAAGSPRCSTRAPRLIGLGGGLFAVSTLTRRDDPAGQRRWRARPCAGGLGGGAGHRGGPVASFIGGALRDIVGHAADGRARSARPWPTPPSAIPFVYHVEIGLLFITLVALGPLVRYRARIPQRRTSALPRIGLADFPT